MVKTYIKDRGLTSQTTHHHEMQATTSGSTGPSMELTLVSGAQLGRTEVHTRRTSEVHAMTWTRKIAVSGVVVLGAMSMHQLVMEPKYLTSPVSLNLGTIRHFSTLSLLAILQSPRITRLNQSGECI